nr:homeodomain-like protein [Tanacetum cinerariifolium]
MFLEDESYPVYDTDNEKYVEPAPKYDFDGDELVYEDEEVCLPYVGYLVDATCRVVIPLNNSYDDDAKVEIVANEKDNGDKKNWLSSTHFWNTNDNLEIVEEKEERGAVFITKIKRLLHLYYYV